MTGAVRPFGIANGMNAGSGGTVANQFDQSARLTVANPGQPKEQTYTYDANSNLTSIQAPSIPWHNRTFTYDVLNRLTEAEGPYGTIDYTYDGVGNRLTKVVNSQTETYSYLTGTNLLQDVTGTETITYFYDANGNITGMGDKTFTYNQNNRLIRVEEDSDVLGEYTYNGLGQRVIKEVDGVTTVFHYDFNGNIVGESNSSGSFTTEYLYRGKGRVAKVDVGTGTMSYYLNDRLGTPLLMTDETNTVIWEGVYKPFGEADVNPNSSVVNNHRFPGQYYDQETGLHYNYHRYYDPRTGRYITPDPIGLSGGLNLFVYGKDNPINLIDLFGLFDPSLKRYQELQRQQTEKYNKWIISRYWYETDINGTKYYLTKSSNPLDRISVRMEGGSWDEIAAGAAVCEASAPYLTVPHPITYFIGGTKFILGLGFIWHGFPDVTFDLRW